MNNPARRMFSLNTRRSTDPDILNNTEFRIRDVAAVLISEICSYLEVHDQRNAKRVCKWWRMNLPEMFLSRLIDMDSSKMLNQTDDFLEHTLSRQLEKNTKILVLRNIVANYKKNTFGIIANVIKQKHADLIQLTLKDCEVRRDFSADPYYWTHPERITPYMVHGLIFATKKLVLENYMMRDALCVAFNTFDDLMPRDPRFPDTGRLRPRTPLVLTRCEFDRTKSLHPNYHSFIMALNSNCPEIFPECRDDVVQLYNSWIHSEAEESAWRSLGMTIKCFNEGVPVTSADLDGNVSTALRQLDPLTFNKLTIYALHCLYF